MKRVLAVSGLLALLVGGLTISMGRPVVADGGGPVVVELFTSQSCYSCPPAEAYLGELVKDDRIIGLEFHVDYWDQLVDGAAGKWKDLFSSPAYTARQRGYAGVIPGGQAYTPQMVIGGREEAVGSRRFAVRSAIREVVRAQKAAHLKVAVTAAKGGRLTAAISGQVVGRAAGPAAVWLIRYDREHTTRVRAGENKGKTLTNHNIVRAMAPIGVWRGKPLAIELPEIPLGANQGCAVIVQNDRFGPILGAAACARGARGS